MTVCSSNITVKLVDSKFVVIEISQYLHCILYHMAGILFLFIHSINLSSTSSSALNFTTWRKLLSGSLVPSPLIANLWWARNLQVLVNLKKQALLIVNISLLKFFGTAWLVQKLNTWKYVHTIAINDNAVQSHLSENYLPQKIIAQNILSMKYSQFTVDYLFPHWR